MSATSGAAACGSSPVASGATAGKIAEIVSKNHNLRPFSKDRLKSAGRGASGNKVLYRTLRVLRCFVKLPCTCLKIGGTRCTGCEPAMSAQQAQVSWITSGKAGVEMVHCPVFRLLTEVVAGLKGVDIAESLVFDHLAKTVLVTDAMVAAKRTLVDRKKKVHYWYDPTERGVEGQKYTVYPEFHGLTVTADSKRLEAGASAQPAKKVTADSKRLLGVGYLEPSSSSFDRELGRAMLKAVADDESLSTERGHSALLMGVDKVLDKLGELTRTWRPCAKSGPDIRQLEAGASAQPAKKPRLTGAGLIGAATAARVAHAARTTVIGKQSQAAASAGNRSPVRVSQQATPSGGRPRARPPPLPTQAPQHKRPRVQPPHQLSSAATASAVVGLARSAAATSTTPVSTPVSSASDASLQDAVAKLPEPIASAWQLLGMPKIVAAVRQDAAKRVLFTQLAKNSSTANCNVAAALVMLCVDAIDKNMGARVGAAVADSGDSDPVADMSSEDARAEQAKSAQEAVQSWSTVCGTIMLLADVEASEKTAILTKLQRVGNKITLGTPGTVQKNSAAANLAASLIHNGTCPEQNRHFIVGTITQWLTPTPPT